VACADIHVVVASQGMLTVWSDNYVASTFLDVPRLSPYQQHTLPVMKLKQAAAEGKWDFNGIIEVCAAARCVEVWAVTELVDSLVDR
jgi:hypothetical protein